MAADLGSGEALNPARTQGRDLECFNETKLDCHCLIKVSIDFKERAAASKCLQNNLNGHVNLFCFLGLRSFLCKLLFHNGFATLSHTAAQKHENRMTK